MKRIYTIVYNIPKFGEATVEHKEVTIEAHNFLDALGKTYLLPKCDPRFIESISFECAVHQDEYNEVVEGLKSVYEDMPNKDTAYMKRFRALLNKIGRGEL